MRCPRCDGLMVEDWDTDLQRFYKCANCGGTMPRFSGTAEEIKRKTDEWAAKCRASRAGKTQVSPKPPVEIPADVRARRWRPPAEKLPAVVRRAVAVQPTTRQPTVTDWLSGSIQAVSQEIERLQSVKGQLEEIHQNQVVSR